MERLFCDPDCLSRFSHKLTDSYGVCDLFCQYIGRSAFSKFILFLACHCSSYSALEILVLSACKSVFNIRFTSRFEFI